MAHQLTTAARGDVALVALIDPTPLPARTLSESIARRFEKFRHLDAGHRLSLLGDTALLTADQARLKIWDVLVQRRLRRGRPIPRRSEAMEAVNRRATNDYVPPPYDGPIVVYRSEGLRTYLGENRALAWNTLVGANVEVFDVAGTSHLGLFTEPYIRSVAEHLKASIDRAVGPTNRPVGGSTATDATGVDPQDPIIDTPQAPTGMGH